MPTDADLYRRWLDARDEPAFAELARRHATLVYDVAWRTGGDPQLAEDALQEALLRLAQDGTERPTIVGVRAWLARLAISKALNARASDRARRKRERKAGGRRAETSMEDDAALRGEVVAMLDRCRRDDAALLAMRYLHALPYVEVGAVLGVPEATARVRVHRALRRARKALRRRDVDEHRLAGLLAGVPVHAPSPALLEGALGAALGGGPAVAAAAAVRVAPWVPRALAVAGEALLAVGSAGLLWWAAVAGRSGASPRGAEHAAAPDADTGPALRGRASGGAASAAGQEGRRLRRGADARAVEGTAGSRAGR